MPPTHTTLCPEWREVAANAIYIRAIRTRPRKWARPEVQEQAKEDDAMGQVIKAVLVLVVIGFAALVGYAYVADISPATAEVKVPVTLHAD